MFESEEISLAQSAERYHDRHMRNKIEGVNRSLGEAGETIHQFLNTAMALLVIPNLNRQLGACTLNPEP